VPFYTLIAAQINQINTAKIGRAEGERRRGGATQVDDIRA
jgi:hypothetical protein